MIGGTVIETVDTGDRIWINCRERKSRRECAIFVTRTALSRAVSEGDVVWWQADRAMWTAKDKAGKTIGKPDTTLKRIGFSGVKCPDPCPNADISDRAGKGGRA